MVPFMVCLNAVGTVLVCVVVVTHRVMFRDVGCVAVSQQDAASSQNQFHSLRSNERM